MKADADRVAEWLLRRGSGLGLTLAELARGTGMETPALRNCLLVLVQHNCVQPFRLSLGEEAGPGSTQPVMYMPMLVAMLQRLRLPRFVQLAKDSLGEEAGDILEAFAEHGRLSFQQLHERATARDPTGDPKAVEVRVGSSMAALVQERMLERVGPPQPQMVTRAAMADAMLKTGGGSRARAKSRPLMEASGYFDPEEFRVASASHAPEAERFRIPHFLQMLRAKGAPGGGEEEEEVEIQLEEEPPVLVAKPAPEPGKGKRKKAFAGAGAAAAAAAEDAKPTKRQRGKGAAAAPAPQQQQQEEGASARQGGAVQAEGAPKAPKGAVDEIRGDETALLWRINHGEFLKRLRHQEVVRLIREVVDPSAAVVASAILQAGKAQETALNGPYSASLSLEAIVSAVRRTEDGRIMAMSLDRVRALLNALVLHPQGLAVRSSETLGGGHYTLQTGKIMELAKMREVEAVITQRFGAPACRIFRLLQKKKCLEQKQVAEMSLIPMTEARKLLYDMLKEEFVHLQEIPKTADHAPLRTFYLWRVSVTRAVQRLLEYMCKAALNLRLRLEHEMHKEHEVLNLLESIQAGAGAEPGPGAGAGGASAAKEKQLALTSGQRAQLERIRKVAAVLETSLLRLDNLIMVFAHF